jgi:hypothetical protein
MTTLERFGGVAHNFQGQFDDQLKQLSKWMKPYAKKMGRLSDDLRPYGEQALGMARKHPGKTAAGALVLGYLLARLGRR